MFVYSSPQYGIRRRGSDQAPSASRVHSKRSQIPSVDSPFARSSRRDGSNRKTCTASSTKSSFTLPCSSDALRSRTSLTNASRSANSVRLPTPRAATASVWLKLAAGAVAKRAVKF